MSISGSACTDESIPSSSQQSPNFANEGLQIGGGKVFQDSIHGTIELHPLLVKIIDTPQFQRLRNIKQLGGTYFVYPGASHNRFEHCIGTAHLAGKLTKLLQSIIVEQSKTHESHPGLIDDKDVLCVEIAGLCHDLGHGPFSHLFDGMYVDELKARGMLQGGSKSHEEMSCDMLEYLIAENNLNEDLKKYGLDDGDLTFVKEMIKPKKFSDSDLVWPYEGRGEDKSFLYEIISNERNKVDVDKWDYFARDCHHLGMKNSFDHERLMKCMRVLKTEGGRYQICARDKECYNLYEMFHVRATLHRRAYQHRVCNVIERMICDAFIEAETSKFVQKFLGKKLSECVNDTKAYAKLDDSIFQIILHWGGKESKILERILKRKLYRYLGTMRMRTTFKCDDISTATADKNEKLKTEDFVFTEVKYSYGMGISNPVDNFLFFSKENPMKPYQIRREEISDFLPSKFAEREVQAFYKSEDDDICNLAKACLEEFCKKKEILIHTGPDIVTPMKKRQQSPSVNDESVRKRLKYDESS